MINNLKEKSKRLKGNLSDDLKYLVKSGKFNFFFMILSTILSFIITWLFCNFTTPKFYGKYLFIFATSNFFALFGFCGISQSLLQNTSKGYDYFIYTSIKKIFKYSLIGSVSIFVFSIYIYFFFEIDFDVLICLIIVGIFFPISSALSIITFFLKGKFKFKEIFIYQLISLITNTLLVILIFLFRSLIFYFFLMYCFQTIINLFFLKRCFNMIENKKFNKIREREALDWGFFLTKYNILLIICLYISELIIGIYFGPAELAYYSVGVSTVISIRLIIRSLISTFFPKFSQSGGTISITFLFLIIFCSILLYIGVIFFLPLYINFFFPKYKKSILYGSLYAITLMLNPFNELISFYFMGQEQKKIMKYQVIYPQIIMLFLLIPFLLLFGIFGIIYVEIIRQIILLFILLLNINKLKLKP